MSTVLTFRQIKVWPPDWNRTALDRQTSPFRSTYSSTLEILDRELEALGARDVYLQVDVTERDLRLDGQIRADANVRHPGVILSFTSRRHGALSYPCDRFGRAYGHGVAVEPWKNNLRAIALGLEALRKVERYGIAERGQQYAGYRELGTGEPIAVAAAMTVEEAARLLCDATAVEVGEDPTRIDRVASVARSLWREASKTHHPDHGGDPDVFARLTEARDLLLEHAP